MNCLSSMVKYLLYILNVIFVAGGVLLIVVGSIMLSSMGNFGSFDQAVNTQTIPIGIIVMGSIIFVVAFFGCCGTIRENVCCTTIYAICMFILFALQLALSIWIFVEYEEFVKRMGEVVDTAMKENGTNGYPMDALQLAFECCGSKSYEDYNGNVPASCCGINDRFQSCSAEIYKARPGCKSEFTDFWSSNMKIIRWSSLIIALFDFCIFAISCCLASAMRRTR